MIAERPTTVSIRSATTAEAVGICPAPRPEKNTRPTASPTTLIALYAPRTSASGVPQLDQRRRNVQFQPAGVNWATASSLMR